MYGIKVAYLGAEKPKKKGTNKDLHYYTGGTHSHKAAINAFGSSYKYGTSYVPCLTFGEVFEKILNGTSDFGVLPLINSTSGQVRNVFDSVLKNPEIMSDLMIVGSVNLHISHDLIGVGKIEDVEVVYSKQEALNQCRKRLSHLNKHVVKLESVESTAGGVLKSIEDYKNKKKRFSAGLASKEICSFYPELNVLAEDVQDKKDNETRFIIVKHRYKGIKVKKGGDRTWYAFTSSAKNSNLSHILSKVHNWGIKPIELHSVILDPFNLEMAYLLEVEGDSESYKLSFFRNEVGISNIHELGCGFTTEENWKKNLDDSLAEQIDLNAKSDLFGKLPKVVQSKINEINCDNKIKLIHHEPVISVESVWATLGITGDDILKTMVLMNESDNKKLLFCCVRGSAQISYRKINEILNSHYTTAPAAVLDTINQNIGAVSPLTAPDGVDVIIDRDVFNNKLIFMGSGLVDVSILTPLANLSKIPFRIANIKK